MRTYFVYALVCPITNIPMYIGRSSYDYIKGRRPYMPSVYKNNNPNLAKWLYSQDYIVSKLAHYNSLSKSKESENKITKLFKDRGYCIFNKNCGDNLSDETKKKLSLLGVGEKSSMFKGWYIAPDGTKYGSSYLAAAVYNKSANTMIKWSKNNLNGWSFELKR